MNQEVEVSYESFVQLPMQKYILGFCQGEDVILYYRDNNFERQAIRIKNYPWYFCIAKKDYLENKALFSKKSMISLIRKIEDDENELFVKVYCRNINRKVMDEKHQLQVILDENKIQHYELDLNSVQRCLVDHKLEIATDYRILYFDIETDDRSGEIVVGRETILSIAAVNQQGKVIYYTGEEKELLKKFIRKMEDYDMICGWNSEGFDVPYLQERLKYNDIWFNWQSILHLDLMQKLMEVNKRNLDLTKKVGSYSLNKVSQHFLGEEKVKHEMGIYEMFQKAPDLLKKYNIQDVMLLLKLDNKLKITKQKIVELNTAGCFLNEYAVSRILDILVLRNAGDTKRVRFRSKPNRDLIDFSDNKESGYVGGYVIEPVKGIFKNVYHFDYTSLYPSIIQTFNISPETWLRTAQEDEVTNEIKTPNNQLFKREIGIIPKTITALLKQRNDIRHGPMKKLKEGSPEYEILYYKQYAFKTIANSFYGILGAPFTRYYQLETAEGITRSGHYLIKLAKKYFEAIGMKVLYGDTDSVFATTPENVDEQKVHDNLNVFLQYHLLKKFKIRNSTIEMKIEDRYDKMLLIKRKKYVTVKNGEMKVKGLELRRREALPLAAKAQEELLKMLLIKECTKEEIINWIEELRDKVMNKMTKEELVVKVKLSKHVDLYDKKKLDEEGNVIEVKESKLPHAKVAKWLKENNIQEDGGNTWEKGCYVQFIVTQQKPKIEAISVHQFDGKYDHTYYWNVKVYAVLQRVLEVVYPEDNWERYLFELPKKSRKKKVEEIAPGQRQFNFKSKRK